MGWWRRRRRADHLTRLRGQVNALRGVLASVDLGHMLLQQRELQQELKSAGEKLAALDTLMADVVKRLEALEAYGAVRQLSDRDALRVELDQLTRDNPGLPPYT